MEKQKNALLIVDAQIGIMWDTYKREETLSIITGLIERARQDNCPIIYMQHEESEGFFTRGSQFWQFHPRIIPMPMDLIISKAAADSFYQTSLQQDLNKLGVTHLIVAGARTEYCIDTTCRAAISLGFDVTLVKDGHSTVDGEIPAEQIITHHNFTLRNIGNPLRKINVIPAEQIILC